MIIYPDTATDFYKVGHIRQYPDNTQFVYSNLTPRSDKWATVLPDFDHKVVNFGIQGVAKWLLSDLWDEGFFCRNLKAVRDDYQELMDASLGAGAVSVKHVTQLHKLGYLPIQVKALDEGMRVPMRVPLLTIQNTHPDFAWLTNYLETQLSAELWKPMTTATTAFEYKRLLTQMAKQTGSPEAFVPWQGHDFSFRGLSGIYDAASSGAGHLLSFFGTDTIPAIQYLRDYYDTRDNVVIGGSVPATEHSVMCMGGQDDEIGTFRRLVTETYPSGIVSIVSDTWDFWRVMTEYVSTLKGEIMSRQPDALGFAKVVFRPDSGDPVKIICGDPEAPLGTPENKGAVECLWDVFGGTVTSTGHRLLDSHVGVIYGDSITLPRATEILDRLAAKRFASANIVFGIGSHTYQHVTRDTFGTAMKATFGIVDGEERILWKSPKTDTGLKHSARGRLRVEMEDGNLVLHENQSEEEEGLGLLKTVFMNGNVDLGYCRDNTLAKIRARLNNELIHYSRG